MVGRGGEGVAELGRWSVRPIVAIVRVSAGGGGSSGGDDFADVVETVLELGGSFDGVVAFECEVFDLLLELTAVVLQA